MTGTGRTATEAAGRLLREPLARFLALGAALFAAQAALDGGGAARLVVGPAEVRHLAEDFETLHGRPPTPEERAALVEDFVAGEVLVREARALGLDRDDAVVRERLRARMEALAAAEAEAATPGEAALRAHFEAHRDRFAAGLRLALEHVALPEGAGAAEAGAALSALAEGASPAAVGRRSRLPPALPAAGAAVVDGVYGAGTFEALARAPVGAWVALEGEDAPRLLRVVRRVEAPAPDFEAVRERVERDWRETLVERAVAERVAALKARYEIVRSGEAGE